MSGIPVYTSSPISAAKKPSGVTPQTSALPFPLPASQASNPPDPSAAPNPPPANSNSNPNLNPTLTTTSTASSSSSYQPSKPGTAAFPAPSAIPVSPATQRYVPLQPTPTTQGETVGPPLPQPGAFPTPVKSSIPPPPKVGESYKPQQTPAPPIPGAIAQQPYPPQMSIPPPTSTFGSQQPRSSTSTTQAASSSYRPVQVSSSEGDGAPRRSLEHPPGYQQNVYASDLTSEQRRAMETNASRENSEGMMGGEHGEGMWNTLGKMAQQAGAKIAETEASVWRSINKE